MNGCQKYGKYNARFFIVPHPIGWGLNPTLWGEGAHT
jgi:hypothetical protein